MSGLIRYVAADAIRAQRWVAPLLCFLAGTLMLDAGGGPVLSCYGATATLLLPVSLWLTIVVVNSEDPIQLTITVVTAGGSTRVRLAKLATSFLACVPLILFALVWPLVGEHGVLTANAVGVGASAHLLTALTGVAFGAVLSRPVVRRTAWAVLAATAICLAETLVPGLPPTWQLLALLSRDQPGQLAGPIVLIALEAVVLSVAVIVGSSRLARARA